jgi:hypothetical protein
MSMYLTKSSHYEFANHFWEINNKPSGCYTPMLKSMCQQLFNMHSHYAKLHVFRFDLHQPTFTETNEHISTFIRRVSRLLKAKYKLKDVAYFWVREHETAPAQHYHFVLFIDGKAVNYSQNISAICESVWQDMSGSYRRAENCFYNCHRNDETTLADIIYRISYFAKGRGKNHKPKQTKNYGASKIKHKEATPSKPACPKKIKVKKARLAKSMKNAA